MSEIFISYKREDRPRAKRIAEKLKENGFSVWWDRKIPAGQSFDQVIQKALDEASCIVVLWSEKSVQSDWVKEEAATGAGRGILMPILIDDVPVPLGFGRLQTANLVDWDGESSHPDFERVLTSITMLLKNPDSTFRLVADLLMGPHGEDPQGAAESPSESLSELALTVADPARNRPRRSRAAFLAMSITLLAAASVGVCVARPDLLPQVARVSPTQLLETTGLTTTPDAPGPSDQASEADVVTAVDTQPQSIGDDLAVAPPEPAVSSTDLLANETDLVEHTDSPVDFGPSQDAEEPAEIPVGESPPQESSTQVSPPQESLTAETSDTAEIGDTSSSLNPQPADDTTPKAATGTNDEDASSPTPSAPSALDAYRTLSELQASDLPKADLLQGYEELWDSSRQFLDSDAAARVLKTIDELKIAETSAAQKRDSRDQDVAQQMSPWREAAVAPNSESGQPTTTPHGAGASLASADRLVTCTKVALDEDVPKAPIGVADKFQPGRIYMFAWIQAPRASEMLTLQWMRADGTVTDVETVKVSRNVGKGYRIYSSRSHVDSGDYEIRLLNSAGDVIGSRSYTVL